MAIYLDNNATTLLDEGVLQQIRFYLRHRDPESDIGPEPEGTRFVVRLPLQ